MGMGFTQDLESTKEDRPRFLVESTTERLERERTEYWDWTHRIRRENRETGKRA